MSTERIYIPSIDRWIRAIPWDGKLSLADGRGWYACPFCGMGLTGPLRLDGSDQPIMIHADCLEAAKRGVPA